MASNNIAKRWASELRRKQKARAQAERQAEKRWKPPAEETVRRTGAPVLGSAEAVQ
ncbi:MAG TPA: hypothetical protein VM389_03050 [Phycisphaerae bacterium]|nr:hypothetical protein [Phycisphaerae bacterium]HUU59299.1 hypothetical protein [Phycisphaerae bacterium]